jgi:hypothetical protein
MAIRLRAIPSACSPMCGKARFHGRRQNATMASSSRRPDTHGCSIGRRRERCGRGCEGIAGEVHMNHKNDVKRTGVIGLGAMGLQMARHMVSKGFDVAGYDVDVDVDAMRRAVEAGVKSCLSPAQVGDHAEIVIVMVATDQQVEEVIGQSGLLDSLGHGGVVCIASSCAPETCRRMETIAAGRGIGVLDCPVVLGQEAANTGSVT